MFIVFATLHHYKNDIFAAWYIYQTFLKPLCKTEIFCRNTPMEQLLIPLLLVRQDISCYPVGIRTKSCDIQNHYNPCILATSRPQKLWSIGHIYLISRTPPQTHNITVYMSWMLWNWTPLNDPPASLSGYEDFRTSGTSFIAQQRMQRYMSASNCGFYSTLYV